MNGSEEGIALAGHVVRVRLEPDELHDARLFVEEAPVVRANIALLALPPPDTSRPRPYDDQRPVECGERILADFRTNWCRGIPYVHECFQPFEQDHDPCRLIVASRIANVATLGQYEHLP